MIIDIIKNALVKKTEAVSAYHSICPRLASYEYNISVKDVIMEKGKNLLSLNLGGYVHAVIFGELEKNGCEVEKPIYLDDYGCPGHKYRVDAVCGDIAVEIKTASADIYRVFWEWQLKVYMSLLGLKRGKLIVIWLPTTSITEYDIYINEKEAEEVKDRVRKVCSAINQHWQNVEPIKGKWCVLCPVKNQCLNEKLIE